MKRSASVRQGRQAPDQVGKAPDRQAPDQYGTSPTVNSETAELLSSSFREAVREPGLASRFYQHFFTAAPESRELFDGVDMTQQGQMVLQAVGLVISGTDRLDELAPVLEGLGYRHLRYGAEADLYAEAARAFCEALRDVLGERFNGEVEAAWLDALKLIANGMIRGAKSVAEQMPDRSADEPRSHQADSYLARFLSPAPEAPAIAAPEPQLHDLPRRVVVEYEGGEKAAGTALQTLLQISQQNGIPHMSECGGRTRCSTCRVLILDGQENCLPRNQIEARLARIKGLPPDIRLACQTRVTGPVRARRLIVDADDAVDAMTGDETSAGREMKLAVLFSDLRGFTSFSEEHLPYDVVHALNRYLGAVCEPIEEHRGYIKDYLGDGIMALFGLQTNRAVSPCVDAVRAALGMLRRMSDVNRYLLAHVGREFRMGIGVSFGPVVAGQVGFRLKRQFTAIGDVVNVAARLEGQTKVHDASLLVTDEVRGNLAELDCSFGRRLELSLAGKSEPVVAHEVLPE